MVNCQAKHIDKRLTEGKYFMYKIILYSDEKQTIEEIFNQHMPYITKNYFKIITIPSDLELNEYNNDVTSTVNIYFLDLTSKNIEKVLYISKLIRKINPYAFIIFISNNTNYLPEYLDILPFAILPKPIEKIKFLSLMSSILSLLSHQDLSLLEIKTKDGITTIDHRLITFVEYENHYLFIHTKHGSTIKSATIRTSFKKWMKPLLKYDYFISPHKSYLVNMDYVYKIMNNHTFIMTTKEVIPIASQTFTKIKAKYLKYIRKKYIIGN